MSSQGHAMSINIDDINTVSDLLKAQQPDAVAAEDVETPEADAIMETLLEEEPVVGITVAYRILYALHEFHEVGVAQYKEEGNIDAAVLWQKDAVLLQQAMDFIEHIAL